MVQCRVGGTELTFLIDSGADANIIAERDWEELERNGAELLDKRISPKVNLRGYASKSSLEVACAFKAWVEVCGVDKPRTLTEFFVVKRGARSLMGRRAAMALRVLAIGIHVNAVEEVTSEFPSVPGVEIDFDVDDSVPPVCHPYVSIPLHFRAPTTERLKEMKDTKIIERVYSAPKWLSGLSAVPKGKGDFRLVINMRGPNRAIRRQYHRMPRIEEMKSKMCGAKWFTKLDLSSAFHHLKLSERSRELTTFMAPDGMYRFTRLVFGVNCAPEIFQREMEKILGDIDGVIVYIDDVLIFARDREKLKEITEVVLERLKRNNLSLNEGKCEYEKESLTFLGHKFSAAGMNIDEVKVADVQGFRCPRNSTELKSFLGLVNYVRDFIPDFASITAPLREIDGHGKFRWSEDQTVAFDKIKRLVADCTVTQGYFSVSDKTSLFTDASPVAIGAVLTQTSEEGAQRIVSFASKSLTATEKKYPQTQREALAIVWAVEHFNYYLLGARFNIKTDAEGMKWIFDKTSTKPKRHMQRAERWAMRLEEYDYTIESIRGVDNIADSPSRLCQSLTEPEPYVEHGAAFEVARIEIDIGADIHFESDHMPIVEVRMAAESCEEMRAVKGSVSTGKWNPGFPIYEAVKNQLEVVEDLLLKNGQVVIPKALRAKALSIAHSGHLGETKTKAALKERVWWPNLNRAVEDWVAGCRACILKGRKHPPAPMQRTKLPDAPWEYLALDYCGPFASLGNIHVVGIVDYFSRFVSAAIVQSTGWKHLEPFLSELFDKFGTPVMMKSDNGPPFSGEQYKSWCLQRGIEPVFSWPLNPQQNGAAEAVMKHINSAVQTAAVEGIGVAASLRNRVRAHNSTPHRETNQVPEELMFNRRVRRGLPMAQGAQITIDVEAMRERDWAAKMKKKEYGDKRRHAREPDVGPGDKVFLERGIKRKGETSYDPAELTVTSNRNGDLTMATEDGVIVRRDVTKVRKAPLGSQPSLSTEKHRDANPGPAEAPAVEQEGTAGDTTEVQAPKRPQRNRKPPPKLDDFVLRRLEIMEIGKASAADWSEK